MRAGLLIAVILAGLASPALSRRTIDYTINEATWTEWAAEQGTPLAPLPARSKKKVSLMIAPSVDHPVTRTGIICSLWKVDNPVGALVSSMVETWADDLPTGGDPAVSVVRVDNASTVSRCVSTGELKSVCITRVSLKGSVTSPDGTVTPIVTSIEEPTKAIGACAGLTRGLALVSRAAVRAFIDQTDKAILPAG